VDGRIDELEWTRRLLGFVTTLHSDVLATGDLTSAFSELLDLAVWLTDSEFGFVGEVEEGPDEHGADRSPVLVSRSLSDIAWDEASRAVFEVATAEGLRFENLDTLFGVTLRTGETVISNDLDDDRRGGTPAGHPTIRTYLGAQFSGTGGARGMIGLANRSQGYGPGDLELLEPLLNAAGSLLDIDLHRREADRARADAEFAHRLEAIMTDLSRDLLADSDGRADAAIHRALEGVGKLADADRAYVFEFDEATECMSNTYEWCAEGVLPAIDQLQALPISLFPWALEQLNQSSLVVTTVDDLPSEAVAERESLLEQHIKSVMWIPLQRDDRTVGFVGFDQVVGDEGWTRYDQSALRSLGNTLSLAIARRRSQSALRDSEHRLRRFAADLDIGMVIVDESGPRGEFVNPAFTRLTGLESEDFGADPSRFFSLVPPEDRSEIERLFGRFLQDAKTIDAEPFDRTFRLVVDARERWVRMRAFTLGENERDRPHVGALVEDVTDIRTMQDTITSALDRLAAANRDKTQFLSRVSHELRSPLQGTLGFLELLRLDFDAAERDEYLGHAERSARHLVDLIDDLLMIGRIESGRLDLQPDTVDLGAVAGEAAGLHALMAKERNLTIEVVADEPVPVHSDERRLAQVLGNLISNAVKYNRPGGSVRVVVGRRDSDGFIEVVDTGPGLSAEDIDRIFVPFERLSAERSNIPGTGIGLVVVKQLVAALGARLEVESTVGVGTTFRVSLPIAAAAAEGAVERRPFRVLHVEDSPESRMVIEAALRRLDEVEFSSAEDLQSGFSAAVLERPDLILLDRHLPDGDGIESIGRFLALADEEHPMRVVIVSADAEPDSRERAIRSGANAYFVKPVRLSELIDYVSGRAARRPA
jgi:PAS domain S-box-containing protein